MTKSLERNPAKLGTISPALQHLAAIAILEGVIFRKYPKNSQRLHELRQHSMESEHDAINAIQSELKQRRDAQARFTVSLKFVALLKPDSKPSVTLQSITSPQGVILDCTGIVANLDLKQASESSRIIARFMDTAIAAASEDVATGQVALLQDEAVAK